ncbi:MAG: MlaD family protein [Bacteroidaceae bacterium]|nr:MlaD family protein [Bacteroidaceae bacterium]
MKYFTKEIRIGLVAILAVAIIYVGMIFLKGMKLFNNDTTYYVEMDNVNGLSIAGHVLANGMQVGQIDNISYNQETQSMLVAISVHPDFRIPEGTTVFTTKEMLGSPRMNLKLGPADAPTLAPGGKMIGSTGGDLMNSVGEMVPQIQALLPKLDSILSAVNTLVNQPALTASLNNLEGITSNLKTTTTDINRLLGKDVPSLMARANTTLGNVESLTNKLVALDVEGLASNANSALSNANSITQQLNQSLQSKNNSLGMLLNDNSIALRIDSTIVNASLLLEDIRLHPKRYVNISVFGRKEK